MSKTYYLKYFDDVLGEVDRDTFIFTPNEDFKKDFPLSFFGGCKNPSPELIKMFLSNLVASKHNQGIDLIMADLRYPVYDLWVLLDATCGIGLSSSYWIVPKEKLHWKFNTHHVKCNPNLWITVIDENGVVHKPKVKDVSDVNDIPRDLMIETLKLNPNGKMDR